MNKIFKVVWNRTIGSFVVTSELAKGRVKSSSEGAEGDVRTSEEGRLKTLFRLTALSAALLGFSEGAWAAMNAKPATGGAVFAIGDGSTSANGTGALAIGNNAQAKTNGALAIGPNSTHTTIANGNNAIAIGVNLQATGQKAIGIGTDTTANGSGAIAIGNNDANRMANQGVNGNGAIGVGSNLTANGNNAIAVGTEAQATAISAVAVGANTQATGAEAVAIGKGAQATKKSSIAIGKNTQAIEESAIVIGSDDPLYGEIKSSSRQGIAIGVGAKATGATQSIALGPDAIASGTQSTSIGNNTRATGDSSIAIGGDDWNIVRTKQVAAAGNKLVHQVFEELTGMPMKQQGEAYGNPFKGTTAGDAAVAIGVAALAEGALSTAFGSGASASGVGAAAFGVGATASQNKSVAIGAGSHTRTDATAVTTATVNGITYGGFAGTTHITPGSQVSFGSTGFERQLKHVAPGAITSTSTDAINGSQLYALHVGSGNIAKAVADALGGNAAVGIDSTNNQGTVTLPSYDVFKGNATPNATGNSATKFNTAAATNVGGALTNLNTYVNQGFAVKDNAGAEKGIVTPGESVQFADGNAATVTVDTEANGNTKVKYDVQVDGETVKIKNGKLTAASQTHFYSVKNEDQTKGNYNNDGATGDNALAAGVDASATANGTTAVGLKAQASAESAIAVGSETKAAAKNAVVIGNKASVEAATGSVASVNGTTTGEGSVAVGAASKASGTNATAVGQAANAFGQNSFAGGQASNALGKSSVALGDGANALNDSAVALGAYTTANNAGATAVGFNTNALGWASFAGGHSAKAEASSAVALGHEAQAVGSKAVAIGKSSHAAKESGIALGDGAKAAEVNAIAIGSTNNAWKEDSIALGRAANADGAASLALGLNSHTRLENAIALGNGANADHSNSIAIGKSSHAAESAGVAIGNDAQALKYSSVVIGDQAQSNNSRSVVIGYHASATNPAKPASAEDDYNQTVAIGAYANAWGDQSTAIGNNVDAKGNSSIAIGADDWDTVAVKTVEGTGKTVKEVYQDYTGDVMATGKDSYTHTTSGEAAVAIGTKSQAIGELSTAFGTGTIAEGVASAAFGMGAKATKGNSVAIGAGSTTTTNAISVNEATVNNLKYSGFAGGNSVNPGDQVSFGSKNYERQLKNVAPGEISNTSTDAINGSQLYAVQNVLGNTAKTVKDVLGGNAKLAEDGSITMSNIGNTGAGNIHDAINSVKETAEKGWKLKVNEEAGSEKIAPDDTVTVKQGKNIRVKRSSKELTIETADDVAFNKVTVGDSVLGSNGLNITNGANPVSLTKDGLNNGGNKVTNIADGAVDTDAASYKQVKAAKTEVQKGTNVAEVKKTEGTDGQAIYTVNAKGTVVSASGADNGLTLGSSEDTTTNVTTYSLDLSDKTKESLKKADSALQNIGVHVNGTDAKTLNQANSKLNFVDGTGTTAENKADGIAFNVNKSTLKAGTGGTVNAGTSGDAFATATDVANAINKAVADSEKTSIVAAGDNTHVASQVTGNETLYTVHADKTTVSVKADGGKLALNPTEVINSNQTKTTNYELDLTDAAKAEIQKGVDAKTAVDTKGITFNGDSGSPVTKKLDETLAIKGDDKNVETEAGTNGIKVKLKDDITLTSVTAETLKAGDSILTTTGLTTPKVTAGDSVLTTDGLTIANGANPVSLTKSGLNNGGNKIAKVAKGTDATDGVNVSQLSPIAKALNTSIDPATGDVAAPAFTVTKADGTKHEAVGTVQDALNKVGEEVSKGLKIAADNGNEDKVNLGETVTYTSKDKNIVTTVADNKIDFSLAEKVTIGKDAANGGKPVVIDGKEGIVSGLTNTTLGGTDFATSNKAATEAQLDATQVNLKNILGGEAKNENGNVSTANIGDTGKGNVHEAIKSVKETAEKGWKLKVNEETSSEKISPDDEVAIKEGKNIKVTRNGKNITVATAEDVEFNAVNATNVIAETVIAGNSVLTTDGLKIGADSSPNQVSLTTAGLNNGGNKIANVAKGTEDTDGVNVSQIKPLATALNTTVGADGSIAAPNFTVNHADGTAGTPVHTVQDALNEVGKELNKGLNIVADNGLSEKVNLGDTVKYTSKDKNIVTTSGTGKAIDFSLAEKVTIGKDAANGGKPVVIDGKEGIVSGLTNTTLGSAPLAGSNKAATEAQLDATQVNLATILGGNAANDKGNVTTNNIGGTGKDNVHEAIAAVKETADKGWNLKANDETDSEKIAAGDTVTVKQGKNIRVKRSGKDLTVETSDDVEFAHVKADSVEATSVVAESVIAGNSVLTTDGLKIGADSSPNQVSLTNAGLNNGGNKIANVAKGTADTDGVNVSQIKPLAEALNTTVGADGSIAAPNFTVNHADGTAGTPVHTVQDALNEVGKELNKGLNIVADNGLSEKVNLGDTVKYTSKDKNIVTTSGTGKAIDFSLAEKVTIGKDAANGGKPVVIDGKEGIVSGLTNTTLGSAPLAGSNKAATEAQLDATQVNLATILGGNAANDKGNVTTNNIGGTGKDNVHEAIAAVKETADKGWNLKANDETDSEKIAAGDTVTVKQGKNIRVKRSGKDLTVETSDDVEFAHVKADSVEATSVVTESVIAGNSVLTTDGLKIGSDNSPNQVSLTTAGLNNGGNKVANVAKGTADTDAVNVSQLNPIAKALNTSINPTTGAIDAPVFTVTKADGTKHEAVGTVQDALDKVGEEVGKGLNIAADNGSSEKVNLGDTVTYTSKDKNIVTTSGTGKAINFSLAEKVTIGKDAANGGKPVVIDGKEGIVSGLTNQALGGADFATKGQAATEEQLNETQANLAKLLGGKAANDKGNVATNDIGGTGKDNVHDAIAAVKETADKGWNLKANDETDSEKIAAGDTVTVKQGKNIRVKRSGKELLIETSDDVEFGTVSATTVLADSFISGNSVLSGEGLKIGADGSPSQVSLTNAGLNNGGNKIANVAKGTAATDAVNVAQLNEQLAATEKTTTVVAGKNVTVSEKVNGNNTEYTVNADKTTLSQAANGAVKVSEGAKDADGVTDYALDLTDEAKADIAKGVAAKDAVDNKGLTFAADNGTTGAKKLGDSLSVKGDGNILTRADENGIGFSLADKITVGKAGKGNKPLVIDGTAGLISGLSNTTLGGADFATKGQAASEEQLNAAQANLANLLGGNAANDKGNVTTSDIGGTGKDNVHDAIAAVKETADKGWNLNANDETSSEKIGAGDTVTFKEGKNVKVSRNGKNITVATSDDVSFDKVTVGGSVLTDNGLTVGNGKAGKPVSLTKDGLNNGGNKVSDIAAGEADTDAVNVAQLKAAAAKATSKVDSGNDNIVVTPEQNADGSTTYKVATAPNLKADSFTAGDTVVNNDGVKVGDKVALGKDGLKAGDVNITADGINAGNKAISNVAAGVKDTDAANVGQLNRLAAAAKTEVEAGTNIAGVTSKQGANGQTVYTVNADGASVSAGSDNIVVTKGNKDADNVTDYAVDLSKAVKADIAKGVAAKDAVDNKGISFAGDSGTTVANKLGDTVAVKGDANITTTAGANGIQVGLNKDLKVDSVKAGDTVVNNNGVNVGDKVALGKDGLKAGDVNITADGINAGGKKVTGVAAGTVAAGSTDAVNGGQLHQVYELIGSNGGNVNTAPPAVEADGKAGLGNIKNITLVDNSNNPNVTNVTNETKIAQSNGYSLVTYNVEDQGMYVTNNVIEAVGRMNEQGIKFFHTNDGEVNPDVQARNGEDSSASGAYATAVGYQAASKGTNAIAIGKGAKANAENTIAIGTGNIVSGKNSGAIGDPTVVSGNSSYSIGNNNNVSADNAYALGSNIKATVKDSVYLGDRAQTQGIHTADAAKGEAYTYGGLNDKAVAGKAGSTAAANKVAGVVTVGNGTDETRQVQGVAAGVVSADSTDAINGSQLYYTNQAIANVATQATAAKTEVTAGKNVVVNQTTGNSGQTVYNVATTDKLDVTSVTAGGVTVNAQGVSIAAPTAHNPANTVSLSPIGLNNGGQRITNVAPAKEGTDAVNLNQLAGVGNALQNNIERVGKKAYAGVAGAIAQGSIPQVTRPGATGIGVGSGYYGGQSAMAIGVSAMSDGGNWVVKGNFSANTDGHVGVGAGALYQW